MGEGGVQHMDFAYKTVRERTNVRWIARTQRGEWPQCSMLTLRIMSEIHEHQWLL